MGEPASRTTTRPVIRGTSYAVSTRKPQATQVAERILRAGGNAFDAAVAAFAMLAVTDPAMTGLGADACILIYDASERKVLSINGAGTAPKLATIDWYNEHCDGKIPVNEGLLSASLPTAVDVCYVMLARWGTMSFTELLAPAIELAQNGFPISEYLRNYLGDYSEKLLRYPTTAKIYFPNGRPLRPGDILRNTDLAHSLTKLVDAEQRASREGRQSALRAARDRFYRGDIARDMADFFEQHGGLYRYGDFAESSVKIEDPVFTTYSGHDIYKDASASQGPTELILLNLLEGFDLKLMGHNTPEYIHISVEAAKLAFADREKYLGDADFIRIPFARLLSKDYARHRRSLIDSRKASFELRPGDADDYEADGDGATHSAAAHLSGFADHHGDTSYLAVVDEHRNAVSFTPSLHSPFGTGVVMGDLGFILNCRGDLYELNPRHPNALAPGKRPRSTLTGTIVIKNEQPFLILGSPGGDDQPLRILQTFLNVAEFGMNIQEAIEAPRWSATSFPASEFPHTMYPGRMAIEDRIPEYVRTELRERGHAIEVKGPWTLNATCAILIDPENGVLSAGADPRGDSYALAW